MTTKTRIGLVAAPLALAALIATTAIAQNAQPEAPVARAPLPPIPAAMSIPKPGPAATEGAYQPQAILQGGIVIPLFPPNSPYLKADKIATPEKYNMSGAVPGRIGSIVSIHNPSIEVHLVDRGLNTGSVVILAAGGGHNTLNVGGESADFVPFFYNYGVNTVILRNRLRVDGYNPQTDEVYDAQQAIRMVRAHAKEWNIDPKKIGIMGFSAGAELSAPSAVYYEDFDKKNSDPSDPLAGISSRPDFVGVIYPGPSPYTVRGGGAAPPIPKDVPPAFIVCGGSGDKGHAVWADDYFRAMLNASVPNIEMHIYARGRHPGDALGDGLGNMSGGLTDRNNWPYGTWQVRFIDWFRDLGFLQKPGIPTQAEKDVAAYVANPPGQGRGGGGGRGAFGGSGGRGGGFGRGAAGASGAAAPVVGVPVR